MYEPPAFVSLRRIQEFLTETELLDEFAALHANKPDLAAIFSAEREHKIGFGRATFTWSAETARERADETERTFRLVIEEDLLFQRGTLNMIVGAYNPVSLWRHTDSLIFTAGPTGCGKTSLLFALLGELHFVQTASDGWYHLPRAGGVAYAAQESWVLNDTIRNNIVFGAPWDAIRYAKGMPNQGCDVGPAADKDVVVVGQCGLERDLALFQAGDETEVGEKGLTLR
jgi:ABC-type multidrug transport system fused ATPase/permease subunit